LATGKGNQEKNFVFGGSQGMETEKTMEGK